MNAQPESVTQEFGQRIRNTRISLGLTIENLSYASGIDVTTLSRIERGRANPRLETVIRLADGLGVTPKSLIHKLETPQETPKQKTTTQTSPKTREPQTTHSHKQTHKIE